MNNLLNASTTMTNDLAGAQTKLKSKIEETGMNRDKSKARRSLEGYVARHKPGFIKRKLLN